MAEKWKDSRTCTQTFPIWKDLRPPTVTALNVETRNLCHSSANKKTFIFRSFRFIHQVEQSVNLLGWNFELALLDLLNEIMWIGAINGAAN